MYSRGVCKRDIGHTDRVPKVFIDHVKGSWPILTIDRWCGGVIGLGGLFCQLNVTEQVSLITMI